MKFTDKLLNASRKNKSWLCIGLDSDPELMPEVDVLQFNKAIIGEFHRRNPDNIR
jgi:orotidine-5'-phosphate decarboxylase